MGRIMNMRTIMKVTFVEHEFLPEEIVGKAFYVPGTNKREQGIQLDLREKWKSKYGY